MPADYLTALAQDAAGLRVGVVSEGFGHPNSEPGVDAAVRASVDVLRTVGLSAEDVSIPWHTHGAKVWDVIATEGATTQMVDGNGYGMNWKGLYDPEVVELTGHPACSVPAGLVNGLPTGMMIIGKHFDDATVLRVAHTFERAVGGFPTQAATAGRRA